jgi:hypothetical protein
MPHGRVPCSSQPCGVCWCRGPRGRRRWAAQRLNGFKAAMNRRRQARAQPTTRARRGTLACERVRARTGCARDAARRDAGPGTSRHRNALAAARGQRRAMRLSKSPRGAHGRVGGQPPAAFPPGSPAGSPRTRPRPAARTLLAASTAACAARRARAKARRGAAAGRARPRHARRRPAPSSRPRLAPRPARARSPRPLCPAPSLQRGGFERYLDGRPLLLMNNYMG